MYWTEDLSELIKLDIIPNDYMSIEDKLNTLSRLIIFISIILALIFNDSKIILFMIILLISLTLIYYYHKSHKINAEKFLEEQNLDIIDNTICVKPTKNNPFMNPNMTSYNDFNNKACPIYNDKIEKEIDKYFYDSVYHNSDDIYNRSLLKRQFYSVPSSKIPNEQGEFSKWLYYKEKSCKENNGEQCYKNVYTPLHN